MLLTLLEPDAGVFSVPSKVLTYLCAGRAMVAAIPPQNLAARIIERSGAGAVAAPGDVDAFVAATLDLLTSPERRDTAAASARAFAEATFDIGTICDSFEAVLDRAARSAH